MSTLIFFLALLYHPWRGPVRASFYAPSFQGRQTASGQIFSEDKLTAASRTIPLGTKIFVRDLRDGRGVVVTVNDRGPFTQWHDGRYKFGLDLSIAAARRLGITWARGWDWVIYRKDWRD